MIIIDTLRRYTAYMSVYVKMITNENISNLEYSASLRAINMISLLLYQVCIALPN